MNNKQANEYVAARTETRAKKRQFNQLDDVSKYIVSNSAEAPQLATEWTSCNVFLESLTDKPFVSVLVAGQWNIKSVKTQQNIGIED